jgi:hypothetical protein
MNQVKTAHRAGAVTLPRLKHGAFPLVLAVSGWLVVGITSVGGMHAVRPLAVFAFALAGPGTAVVRLLPVTGFPERAVLAVAISVSLATLVAEAAYIGHLLRPDVMLMALATACSAAAAVELARGGQRGAE